MKTMNGPEKKGEGENLTDIFNSQEHLQSAALNTFSKFIYFK